MVIFYSLKNRKDQSTQANTRQFIDHKDTARCHTTFFSTRCKPVLLDQLSKRFLISCNNHLREFKGKCPKYIKLAKSTVFKQRQLILMSNTEPQLTLIWLVGV